MKSIAIIYATLWLIGLLATLGSLFLFNYLALEVDQFTMGGPVRLEYRAPDRLASVAARLPAAGEATTGFPQELPHPPVPGLAAVGLPAGRAAGDPSPEDDSVPSSEGAPLGSYRARFGHE
jgi:hypothetical protein